MRKLSYIVTFFAVLLTFILNVLSEVRSDWLVIHHQVLHTRFTTTYGLAVLCEYEVTRVPGPHGGKTVYGDVTCRSFPMKVRDGCENENQGFCAAWTSARYLVELAVWCAAVSLCAIAFGVTTHSRRRRIWRVVAVLILLHAIFQITTFGLVTDMYVQSAYSDFEHADLGAAYICNILSWILSLLIGIAVITTGISADKGHRWAAGNRLYTPIP